jgi:ribosomal-protein-alanine N-acetyltransferase
VTVTSAYTLRDAGADDLAALALLHARCFADSPWDRGALARLVALPVLRARLMEDGRRSPLGFQLSLIVAGEAEILTLCVDANLRRQGLGRVLLRDLYAEARAAAATRLVLEVAADNHPALRLYESEGFAHIGRRPFYYRRGAEPAVDALILARDIEPLDSPGNRMEHHS